MRMATHFIKRGHGYWDISQFPIGGAFRRAPKDRDVPYTPEGTCYQNPKTMRGPHSYGTLADGTRVAVQEGCFAPVD